MKKKRFAVLFVLADEYKPAVRSEWNSKNSAMLDFLDMVDGIIQTDDVRSYKAVYVLDRSNRSKPYKMEF